MIVPASFNKEIDFLCGLKFFAHILWGIPSIESTFDVANTVEPLYSTIGGVPEMRSCYRRIVVK